MTFLKRMRVENRDQLIQLVKKSQADPAWWMQQACGWNLWDKQKEIVNALVHHERVAVPAAFGVGKTYIAARAALWWLNTHRPSKVITTAPTMRQVKDLLWSELRSAHAKSKRKLGGEPLKLSLSMDDEWYAIGFATDAEKMDQFTGYHSPHMLVIFDQAAGIDRGIWEGAEGLMTGAHARWLAISNTTDSTSVMAEISEGERTRYGKWHVMKITAYDSPNVKAGCDVIPGIISHDWIDKKREVWEPGDPMWQIFVEANFVDEAQMTFLTGGLIKQMMHSDVPPDFNHIVIGLDVADEGLDSTVWTATAGPRLLLIDQVFGNDPMQVVSRTQEVWNRVIAQTGHKPHTISVDKIGVGSGVVSRLQELGYNAMGVNVSEAPHRDPEQFLNLRAEMGWTIRDKAESNGICLNPLLPTPDHFIDKLREELTIRYKILSSGRIQMEPKKEIRKRLDRSPDFWDSMMLAFGDAYAAPEVNTVGVYGQPDPQIQELAQKESLTLSEAFKLLLNAENDHPIFDEVVYEEEDAGWEVGSNRTVFW